jgi:hypothetical protein
MKEKVPKPKKLPNPLNSSTHSDPELKVHADLV